MTEQSNSSLEEDQVPVIDLSNTDHDDLVRQIAGACSEFGFFQVSSHGIPLELLLSFRAQCRSYFALDKKVKIEWKRHAANARGYFDDELTKQRRDWKECLDLGVPYSRDWNLPDSDEKNGCLDGWNQFPSEEILPGFRNTMIEYFSACAELSLRLAVLMAQGLGRGENEPLLSELKERHTSYLRLNYYPPYCREESKAESKEDPTPLGISPHKDAGFLTVLLQDDGCHSLQVLNNNCWKTVHPAVSNDGTPSLTINTGDIAQVWSNGKYQAPLHRVLTNPSNDRYSAPFFYNPAYDSFVLPVVLEKSESPKYHGILWGYFRAVRFAGDLTDLGAEIQVDDYKRESTSSQLLSSHHLERQRVFSQEDWSSRPFSVDRYRELLQAFPNTD